MTDKINMVQFAASALGMPPKKPVEWPDAARHVATDIQKVCDAADTLREEFGMMREGYDAAQQRIANLERDNDMLLSALEDARDALFNGHPVTVGLERQILNAIAAVTL